MADDKHKKRKPTAMAKKAVVRKDRVLQARVSQQLYADLADRAVRLRVPVSNLVRNILEDSVRMVGNIVDGSFQIAEALGRPSADELAAVAGWQPMRANRRLSCARCGKPIAKGREAFASVGAPDSRVFVICPECQCAL